MMSSRPIPISAGVKAQEQCPAKGGTFAEAVAPEQVSRQDRGMNSERGTSRAAQSCTPKME